MSSLEASLDSIARMAEISHALSALYSGLPVYLVGSGVLAEQITHDPNDIDIVIPIPDDLFEAMYGSEKIPADAGSPSPQWKRWARDCAKQSRELTMVVKKSVDFKTQPLSVFETYSGPRRRLDCNLFGWKVNRMKTTETIYKCDGSNGCACDETVRRPASSQPICRPAAGTRCWPISIWASEIDIACAFFDRRWPRLLIHQESRAQAEPIKLSMTPSRKVLVRFQPIAFMRS